jgi:hypothetical protein
VAGAPDAGANQERVLWPEAGRVRPLSILMPQLPSYCVAGTMLMT